MESNVLKDLPPSTYEERLAEVVAAAIRLCNYNKVFWREYSEECIIKICIDFKKSKQDVLQDYKDRLWNFFNPF